MEVNERPAEHNRLNLVQWRADAAFDPRQWVRDWVSYYPLFQELVRRNVKARYAQSVLGLYWVFINPLITTLVLTAVFSSLLVRFPVEGTPYFLFILAGLLGWNFFANSVMEATYSLVSYSTLLDRVPFPREVLPSAAVTSRLVDFAASAVFLLVLVVIFSPQDLGLNLLWLPLLLSVQFILVLGLGLILSMANLFYRDVQHLVQLVILLGFFMTPVIYPLDLVSEQYRAFYLLNPMAGIIEGYRSVLLFNRAPDLNFLAIAGVISLLAFVAGYWLFKRWEPQFAERV